MDGNETQSVPPATITDFLRNNFANKIGKKE